MQDTSKIGRGDDDKTRGDDQTQAGDVEGSIRPLLERPPRGSGPWVHRFQTTHSPVCAVLPHAGVIGEQVTGFLNRWNYPQPRGTRPEEQEGVIAHSVHEPLTIMSHLA